MIRQTAESHVPPRVADLELGDIMSVYSGRAGACCCGCAGKYSTASAHVEASVKNRGYRINPEPVNDRMVKKVFTLVKLNASQCEDLGSCISLDQGNRTYTAYLLPREVEDGPIAPECKHHDS